MVYSFTDIPQGKINIIDEIEGREKVEFQENKDLIDEGIFNDEMVINNWDDEDVNIGLPRLEEDNEDDYFEALGKE